MLSWHTPQCKVPFPFYIFRIVKEQRKSPKYRISTLKLQSPSRKLRWLPEQGTPQDNSSQQSRSLFSCHIWLRHKQGLWLSPPRDKRRTWGPLITSPALSPRVQGHTTSLKSFRLFSPQEGILFKKHCKPPDTSGAIQVPSTTSDTTKTSRRPRETEALLQHSWRPGEVSERLLLPHCPTAAHPWAALAVRGCSREEDRATQWNININEHMERKILLSHQLETRNTSFPQHHTCFIRISL